MVKCRLGAWLVAVTIAWALHMPRVAAQEPAPTELAARRAFEQGREDYEQGDFAVALAHFERAYALHPSPVLLFNIGRAADSDGQPARAIEAYTGYLDGLPGATNREFVSARIAKMRALERERTPRELPPVAMPEEAPRAFVASPAEDRPARWRRAWIWTAVGAVVAGGVVASVLLATRSPGAPRAEADAYVVLPEAR